MRKVRLAIIGGGPAGYTAALYAARAALSPLCIEGYMAGGLLMTTDSVENYPGFAQGIGGPQLMMDLRLQAERFGSEFITKDVTRVDLSVRPFKLWITGEEIHADAVIVATGARPKRLNLPSEDELEGYGVAYCAACDGLLFEDQRVAIVGGGDYAIHNAMSLAKIAREVVVIHRREQFRAAEIMVDYARGYDNISFLQPYTVQEILGREGTGVTGVRLRDERTGNEHEEALDGVFISIGHQPATELVQPYLAHDEHGYLKVAPNSTVTSIPGVFAAGDVHDRVYRQVVTAAGSGCMAALDAERWLDQGGADTTKPSHPWVTTVSSAGGR